MLTLLLFIIISPNSKLLMLIMQLPSHRMYDDLVQELHLILQ